MFALAAGASGSGCATVTRGTSQDFTVVTEPPGARAEGSNGLVCVETPCTFHRVDREVAFTMTISKPGYVTSTHQIEHQAMGGGSAGFLGNILIGGVVGMIVDANSGATQDLFPNPLTVTLAPEGAAPAAPSQTPTP